MSEESIKSRRLRVFSVHAAGCSKCPSSKAAASEGPEAYPLGYVESLNDARMPLADFFNRLPDEEPPLARRWAWTVACVEHAYDDSKNIFRPAPRL